MRASKSKWILISVLTLFSTTAFADDSITLPLFTGKVNKSLDPAFKDIRPALVNASLEIKPPSFVVSYSASVDPKLNVLLLNMTVREYFITGDVNTDITISLASVTSCDGGTPDCRQYNYHAAFTNGGNPLFASSMPQSGDMSITATQIGSSLVLKGTSTLDSDPLFGSTAAQLKMAMMETFKNQIRQRRLGYIRLTRTSRKLSSR